MSEIEYRDFDGDLDALSKMARESWFEEYGVSTWPDLYQPALARHFFADVHNPRYLVGAYDGARLVAFVANLPRTYRLDGQQLQGVMSCLMVGHRDYRRRGIAVGLIGECLSRNEELGCDVALMTLERKHSSALLFDKHLKPNHRIEVVRRLYPIARPIDFETMAEAERLAGYERAAIRLYGAHRPLLAPTVKGEVRPYRPEDLDEVSALVEGVSDDGCLVRVFDGPSLARRLHTEGVTSTVVYDNGSVSGFANITRYELVDRRGTYPWAWLDYVVWDKLDGAEKQALLAGVWRAAQEQGCIGLLEWNKGYTGVFPLIRARFIAYPRFIDLNAWVFRSELSLRGKAMFEQQI